MKAIKSNPIATKMKTIIGLPETCERCRELALTRRDWSLKDGRSFRQFIHETKLQESSSQFMIFRVTKACTIRLLNKPKSW